jgi:hypothetical protein
MEENNENTIRGILPQKCPHCGKDILISISQTPATISNLYTKEQIKEAKTEVIQKLAGINIEEKEKESILNWLNDENTVFGPEDSTDILNNILKTIKKD